MLLSMRVGAARKTVHPRSVGFPASRNRLLVVLAIAVAGFATTACNLLNPGAIASPAASPAASQPLSIRGDFPQATVGQAYNSVMSVSGGLAPYQFALDSGTLPAGVTLSPASGSISGVIAKPGTYTFTVVVTDLPHTDRGSQQFALSATSLASQISVSITPSSSITLKSGASQQFKATVTGTSNTQVTWSASAGTISPTGLFTAPSIGSETSATVTATSVADTRQTSAASILVQAASNQNSGPDNRYCSPGNQADFGATNQYGPATLPGTCVYTALSGTPSPGAVTQVAAGFDLDSADDAKCGDTLMLESGAAWTTGQLLFPAKKCTDSNWITIRTDAPDSVLPAEGTRMTPCYAGVSSLPGRPSLNCSSTQNVLARIEFTGGNDSGPLVFENGATHYRFIGIEVTKQLAGMYVNALASAANGAAFDHIVFDRVRTMGMPWIRPTRGIHSLALLVLRSPSSPRIQECPARPGRRQHHGKHLGWILSVWILGPVYAQERWVLQCLQGHLEQPSIEYHCRVGRGLPVGECHDVAGIYSPGRPALQHPRLSRRRTSAAPSMPGFGVFALVGKLNTTRRLFECYRILPSITSPPFPTR